MYLHIITSVLEDCIYFYYKQHKLSTNLLNANYIETLNNTYTQIVFIANFRGPKTNLYAAHKPMSPF